MNPDFESPLKTGMIVKCRDGLVVEILSDPLWASNHYTVEVEILRGIDGYLESTKVRFVHKSPGRFGASQFEKFLTRWDRPESLEEEFFRRIHA